VCVVLAPWTRYELLFESPQLNTIPVITGDPVVVVLSVTVRVLLEIVHEYAADTEAELLPEVPVATWADATAMYGRHTMNWQTRKNTDSPISKEPA